MLGSNSPKALPRLDKLVSVHSLFWSTRPKLLRNSPKALPRLDKLVSVHSLFWSTRPKLLRNSQSHIFMPFPIILIFYAVQDVQITAITVLADASLLEGCLDGAFGFFAMCAVRKFAICAQDE